MYMHVYIHIYVAGASPAESSNMGTTSVRRRPWLASQPAECNNVYIYIYIYRERERERFSYRCISRV